MRINSKILPELKRYLKDTYSIDSLEDKPELEKAMMDFQYWIDEAILNNYFRASDDPEGEDIYWSYNVDYGTKMTGALLRDKLQALINKNPNARILDVGCGDNGWKQIFPHNVTGIDPFNHHACVKAGILEYESDEMFDAVLCLGSINFGDRETIFKQVKKAAGFVKQGGQMFWRCNPGITHGSDHAQWIDFFPWTHQTIIEFAEELDFFMHEISWDHKGEFLSRRGNRLYSEWTKN